MLRKQLCPARWSSVCAETVASSYATSDYEVPAWSWLGIPLCTRDTSCVLIKFNLLCLIAGASQVVLLDREPLALQCALLSAAASSVSVHGHSWERFCTDDAAAIPYAEPPGTSSDSCRQLDPASGVANDTGPARLNGRCAARIVRRDLFQTLSCVRRVFDMNRWLPY